MSVVKKYMEVSLILRIAIGLVIGALIGIAIPGASGVAILGNVFVGALKSVAPVLVFVLVMSSLANASGGLGARFRNVIILYMVSTLCAAFIAVASSFLFPIALTLNASAAEGNPPGGMGGGRKKVISYFCRNGMASVMPFPLSSVHSAG